MYVATLPTCGPLLILPPALKRSGPPRRQGLCSHPAQLWAISNNSPPTLKRWATSDCACRSEAVGTPQAAGLCSHPAHLWATSFSILRSEVMGTPRRQGLCSHPAHLSATSDSAALFGAVGHF